MARLSEDLRSKVLGEDARPTHSREAEIEAIGEYGRVVDRVHLDMGVNGGQLAEGI